MNLLDFVCTDAIVPDLKPAGKEDAIAQLVASLKDAGKLPGDEEPAIVAAVLKREELGSTGIGNGVAVPHTKHPAVDRLTATVGLVHEGIDFASLDGEPVYIMILLVSPPENTRDHLRALETVSRHLKNDTFCNFLKQAKTADEVVELLREADEGHIS
ncbi:PTS sugar transporter subunit IIA [Alienimonas chondri]|uniref:PTS system mannose-specific EIIBCA component n=1 Tax=Alienimonas chondri TaxID=2681879 RepID=A0ABX1V8V5_9PLAN|nr:PTS sugar transporter subunit IIA [Alienimonas chondri]NNJ24258.1 PTS system mannose-specific EIIBCA component [Alienimonas chondri]